MKKKILIVGRTGSGKDYLANRLCDRGFTQVKSYTTRPKRTENEDTHIFITKEEAIKYRDRVAQTVIADNEYFATREQVRNNDIYIIDPKGLYQLISNMPREDFIIIYVTALSKCRYNSALSRVDKKDYNSELYTLTVRDKSESKQFSEFENTIKDLKIDNSTGLLKASFTMTKNVDKTYELYLYVNSYSKENCENWIDVLLSDLEELS